MRLIATAVFFLNPILANAQSESLVAALENPYVQVALEISSSIESGAIKIDKSVAIEEIMRRLDARNNFESLETDIFSEVLSRNSVISVAEMLPPSEELPPVSEGVQLLIAGSVLDQVSEFQERGIEPNVESLLPILGTSLYITLASAALEIKTEEQEPVIDVVSVRRGGIRFFSLGWPFCCSHDYR